MASSGGPAFPAASSTSEKPGPRQVAQPALPSHLAARFLEARPPDGSGEPRGASTGLVYTASTRYAAVGVPLDGSSTLTAESTTARSSSTLGRSSDWLRGEPLQAFRFRTYEAGRGPLRPAGDGADGGSLFQRLNGELRVYLPGEGQGEGGGGDGAAAAQVRGEVDAGLGEGRSARSMAGHNASMAADGGASVAGERRDLASGAGTQARGLEGDAISGLLPVRTILHPVGSESQGAVLRRGKLSQRGFHLLFGLRAEGAGAASAQPRQRPRRRRASNPNALQVESSSVTPGPGEVASASSSAAPAASAAGGVGASAAAAGAGFASGQGGQFGAPGSSSQPRLRLVEALEAHEGGIWAAAISPSRRFLATGGHDGVVRLFQISRPDLYRRAAGAESSLGLASSDSVSASADAEAGSPLILLRTFLGHRSDVVSMSWSAGDFLLTAGMDGTVRLWHPLKSYCLALFENGAPVTSVCFSLDTEKTFYTVDTLRNLKKWAVTSGSLVACETEEQLVSVQYCLLPPTFYHSEKRALFCGGLNGEVYVKGPDTLETIDRFSVHSTKGKLSRPQRIVGMSLSPSGYELLVSTADSRIRVYSTLSYAQLYKLKGHQFTGRYGQYPPALVGINGSAELAAAAPLGACRGELGILRDQPLLTLYVDDAGTLHGWVGISSVGADPGGRKERGEDHLLPGLSGGAMVAAAGGSAAQRSRAYPRAGPGRSLPDDDSDNDEYEDFSGRHETLDSSFTADLVRGPCTCALAYEMPQLSGQLGERRALPECYLFVCTTTGAVLVFG